MGRTQLDDSLDPVESFTITEFKERAREVIDLVADHKAIAILRHKMPDAVLISAGDYVEYMKLRRERLNFLSQRYDDLVARMQTAAAAAGVDALFNASPGGLGPRRHGGCDAWLIRFPPSPFWQAPTEPERAALAAHNWKLPGLRSITPTSKRAS